MNIKQISFVLILFFQLISAINAQITDPKATEYWEPVPRIVTPNTGNRAPSDAIVLFNGANINEWVTESDSSAAKWTLNRDSSMTVAPSTGNIKTKRMFGDCQLHLEFRTPPVPDTTVVSQQRGNSGVFFQGRYEVQILDCYKNRTYSNGQTGSIYKQSVPLVNVCRKPMEWQTYDIVFTAPRFNADGIRIAPGYITVLHNGVLIQNHTEIKGTTEYIGLPKNIAHGKGPIILQDHGNYISYRNIWIREL